MTDMRGGRAGKPAASGPRGPNCARPWAGHAGRSCYQTFMPAGLVYRSITAAIARPKEPTA